jgi:hypothetical protein
MRETLIGHRSSDGLDRLHVQTTFGAGPGNEDSARGMMTPQIMSDGKPNDDLVGG